MAQTNQVQSPATAPRKRWLWWGGACALVAAAALAGWALRSPRADAVELRKAPLVRSLQFSARVATLSRVDVGSTITGRVERVQVREGAQVRAGELLVALESQELSAALAQAVAAEQQAQARLAGLRTTGRAAAGAAEDQARAALRNAEAELQRARRLVAQGFVSASRLDETQRAMDVARAQLAGAQAQSQANADAGTEVNQARAQLAVARAATQAARAKLAQAEILAPADARVLSRSVEPGQIVQPGRSLLSLALSGPTQLVAQMDERFLEQLRTGQQAFVVADAFAGQRFAARVLSIAPVVDAQRGAIEVKFALAQQTPDFLREDMTLSVEVETARRDAALVIPLAALRAQAPGEAPAVLVAQDGRARSRTLRLGLRTLDAVEVQEGLAEGELVLLDPALAPGGRVRPQVRAWRPVPGGVGQAALPNAGVALTNAMGR